MSRVRSMSYTRLPALLLGLLAVLVILAFGLSEPTSFSPGQVLIIGDSITEKPAIAANNGNKGWWEYLLGGRKDMFKFSAESGSGYIAKGHRGTTFHDRLSDISRTRPRAVIIAGGVNDRHASNPADAIRRYYDALARTLKKTDVPLSNVYVFVPRPAGTAAQITDIVKANAERIGVNFILIPAYGSTFDGLHPDSAGAKSIEYNFAKLSNFDERLR